MEFRFIRKTLVYEYAALAETHDVAALEPEAEWRIADSEVVETAFRNDAERIRRFHGYLQSRHTGLILARGGRWIAYGWCGSPQAEAPPHLPPWTSNLAAYWIFGCHTHERYRCRGIYKQLLARLTALILAKESSFPIYIDTRAENIPSRRAILASGFRPRGIFSTYRVWAPLMGPRIIGGCWRRDESHPDLAAGRASGGVKIAEAPAVGVVPYKVRPGSHAANFD
jgi:RimJ/RimL family protein N-acetyltransferase